MEFSKLKYKLPNICYPATWGKLERTQQVVNFGHAEYTESILNNYLKEPTLNMFLPFLLYLVNLSGGVLQ